MFLGGKKKGWMMGQQVPAESRLQQTAQNSYQMVPLSGHENKRTGTLPLANSAAQSCPPPPVTPLATASSLKPSPNVLLPSPATLGNPQWSKSPSTQPDAVLPSPAPSDEIAQASIHIIDLEGEEEQDEIRGEQPARTQLIQEEQNLTAEPRAADGQENQLGNPSAMSARESATIPSSRNDIPRQSPSRDVLSPRRQGVPTIDRSTSAASIALNKSTKRTVGDDEASNKRSQKLPGIFSADWTLPYSETSTAKETNVVPNAFSFSPSENDMQQLKRRIASRLEFVQAAQAQRGPIEDGRLLLLRDACDCADHDYLLLHQLHCMRSRDPLSIRPISEHGFDERHVQGLSMLDQLIRANTDLVDDAVEWFSNFPLPNRELLERYGAYQLSYGRILRCLEKLAEFLPRLRATCHERHYAPLVDELNGLDLRSVVLQRVISRAILRNIWLLPQDQCFHNSEQLFLINQQDVYQRDTQTAISPAHMAENKKTYNQNLIISYLRLWSQHQVHYNQYQQNRRASEGRASHYKAPHHNSQRRLSQQTQIRTAAVTSVNNAQVFNQPRRPYEIDTNFHANGRGHQSAHATPPILSSPPFSGMHMSPVPWSQQSAERHSSSSILPSPGVIVPSSKESIGTIPNPLGYPSTTPAPPAVHGRPQIQLPQRTSSNSSVPTTTAAVTVPELNIDSYVVRPPVWTNRPESSHTTLSRDTQVNNVHLRQNGTQQQPGMRGSLHSHHPRLSQANRPLDLRAQTQRLQRQSPYISPPQLLPPVGHVQDAIPNTDPIESALHQAHVRSPVLRAVTSKGELDKTMKYFQYIWGLAIMPNRLHMQKRHVRWVFTVSKESVQLLAKTLKESNGSPSEKNVRIGSRLCRIRCVQASSISDNISETEWAVADNTWPRNVAIILNGTALEIRRKFHHGKDLPVDVTQYIQEGQNTLSIATMWLPQDNNITYTIGLETLQVISDTKIKEDVATLGSSEAQRRIIEHANKLDPDIQVIDPSIILDITDPYTSSIYEIPVRGKSCRHNQCFDLDVFLQTRASKTPSEPCEPDQFKCPLCGGDARPHNLVIDGFLREVRLKLSKINRLDARAIILQDGGDWHIKEVEETGESGYGSGRRLAQTKELPAARVGKGSIHMDQEVIEIDDE